MRYPVLRSQERRRLELLGHPRLALLKLNPLLHSPLALHWCYVRGVPNRLRLKACASILPDNSLTGSIGNNEHRRMPTLNLVNLYSTDFFSHSETVASIEPG
jgi:hypothetical protein